MQNEHFIPGKDASLEHSIASMQGKLATLGFELEECSWLNPVDNVWSVHVRNRECPLMFTNGKGATKLAAHASASGFIEMALVKLRNAGRMVHQISNILIELRGSVAAVESSFLAFQQDLDAQGQPVQTLLLGRYVDRFEQREGQWRVAARTVVYDWIRQQAMTGQSDEQAFGVRQPNGARQPADPLYAMLKGLPAR